MQPCSLKLASATSFLTEISINTDPLDKATFIIALECLAKSEDWILENEEKTKIIFSKLVCFNSDTADFSSETISLYQKISELYLNKFELEWFSHLKTNNREWHFLPDNLCQMRVKLHVRELEQQKKIDQYRSSSASTAAQIEIDERKRELKEEKESIYESLQISKESVIPVFLEAQQQGLEKAQDKYYRFILQALKDKQEWINFDFFITLLEFNPHSTICSTLYFALLECLLSINPRHADIQSISKKLINKTLSARSKRRLEKLFLVTDTLQRASVTLEFKNGLKTLYTRDWSIKFLYIVKKLLKIDQFIPLVFNYTLTKVDESHIKSCFPFAIIKPKYIKFKSWLDSKNFIGSHPNGILNISLSDPNMTKENLVEFIHLSKNIPVIELRSLHIKKLILELPSFNNKPIEHIQFHRCDGLRKVILNGPIVKKLSFFECRNLRMITVDDVQDLSCKFSPNLKKIHGQSLTNLVLRFCGITLAEVKKENSELLKLSPVCHIDTGDEE